MSRILCTDNFTLFSEAWSQITIHLAMHLFKVLKLITTELTVQFTSSVFSGFESSGEVLVTLALSGGVNSSNITV